MSQSIDPMASELARHLQALEAPGAPLHPTPTETLHVNHVGSGLYVAYEQLRNAAEYTEDHLLLRRAIERFLHRVRALRVQGTKQEIGTELITELTQSGYIKNDAVPLSSISQIDQSLQWYVAYYWHLRTIGKVPIENAMRWITQIASTDVERQLHPRPKEEVFLAFAHSHFLHALQQVDYPEFKDEWTYDMALYTVVHQTLLKSDLATTRYWFLHKSGKSLDQLDEFIRLNELVEELYKGEQTIKLSRIVRRYCPTFRILIGIIAQTPHSASAINDRSQLLSLADIEIARAYRSTRKRLRSALIRSVVFVFITKTIIGLSLEVPYDLATVHSVAILPLMFNLLFPPAYMALVGFSISTPDAHNVKAIKNHIDRIFYQPGQTPITYTVRRQETSPAIRRVFSAIYIIMFGLSFGLLVGALARIGFNIVQGLVFFVFLSTVSFLGLKLVRTAHEFELLDQRSRLVDIISSFLMTPFVRAGQWITDKYSRVNLVTFLLDIAIEVPLKTSLRLVQQWTGFLRDKRDEL
ncbi:MAG TPA: hypothetical protein VNX65_02470 [Patescibacteria group bacterium]|nr:hypothetical protein [Patescibacteria group bacterium]